MLEKRDYSAIILERISLYSFDAECDTFATVSEQRISLVALPFCCR